MNGRWSKWLILAAVLVLVNAPVFSSGEQDSSGVVPGDGDPFGKYTPAIEVSTVRYIDVNTKFMPGNPDADSWEVNKITRRLEEELGIKIKYDWIVPQDQFNTKWNLTIASGNLPDVMRMNVRQFQELSTADAILDVTKYVDEYTSPALEWLYELDEGFTRDASTVNGKLYSVPITGTSPNNTPLLWIRKDWLDKVGLDVPATMDEFMEVARAFTNNDPDGNGKKDTYGLAMNKTFEGGTSNLNGFLNGFDAYFNTWIKGGDGLVFSTVQPEMKDALLAMQKMYAEGLVDPEFSVKDPVKAGELTVSGRVGMLYGRTWACYVQIKQNSLKDLDAEWLPFPIPSVDGTSGPQASGSVNNMTFFGVNKKFAHPEAAVKLVNFYADNYFFAESPKAWTDFIQYDKGDGTSLSMIHYNVIEPSTPWKDYNQYVQLQEAIKVNDRSILRPYVQVVYDSVADYIADPTLRDYLPSYLQVGPVGSQSIVQKYRLNDQVVYDEFIGFSPPTMLEKESTLDAKVLEVFTRIIMGEPVEEFDQLVKDWNALGGEQITKEVNDWYKTR